MATGKAGGVSLSPKLQFEEVARTVLKMRRLGLPLFMKDIRHQLVKCNLAEIARRHFKLTDDELMHARNHIKRDLNRIGIPKRDEQHLSPCHTYPDVKGNNE